MQASIFRFISVGRATENLTRNNHMLNVLPIEDAMGTDGEIDYDPQRFSDSYVNDIGETIQVENIVSRDYMCQWLPSEDNRLTPPDIRRGELVEIWRQGDTNKYYWRSMGLKNNLRSLESVIFAFGATPELGGHQNDLTKCYLLSVSAHDKHFTLSTSKANGEEYAYTIQINSKESAVYITDDDDNFFELDSKDTRLQLKNKYDSYVKVQEKFIEMNADEYIDFKVGSNNFRMTPDSTKLDTPSTIEFISGSLIRLKTATLEAISSAIKFIRG